jgi:hypothetical protein
MAPLSPPRYCCGNASTTATTSGSNPYLNAFLYTADEGRLILITGNACHAERNATTTGNGGFIVTVTTPAPTNSTFTNEATTVKCTVVDFVTQLAIYGSPAKSAGTQKIGSFHD